MIFDEIGAGNSVFEGELTNELYAYRSTACQYLSFEMY